MSTSDLSPAGSSSYSSSTLHVGDGTWDNGRDDFLLPNLVGLNFATMQYNGMGNRFKNLPEYHQLITGHGVLAAVTFLLILPIAIWSAKFWRTGGRKAVRLHVYCQILVLVLSTVVLVLGWFAVGPERSLTNPHHGIGVALYTMIWVQFLFGWLMGRLEKKRKAMPHRVPTKVWIHKLFGRSIALLGIIQIALGLTLYGSPKVLFILYALWVALLLFAYLALDRYYYEKRPLEYGYENAADFYSDYGSYVSGSRTEYTEQRPPPPRLRPNGERRDESHWGRNLLAGAGALGAYEAFKNRRTRKREEREQAEINEEERRQGRQQGMAPSGMSSRPGSRPPPGTSSVSGPPPAPRPAVQHGSTTVQSGVSSGPPPRRGPHRPPQDDSSRLSPTSWEDEKYNQRPQRHTWRDRILGAAGGVAAFEGVRRLLSRRHKREGDYQDDDDEDGRHYQNMVSQTDGSRIEQGQSPLSPDQTPGRVNVAGGHPMTPTQTPSRPPRRARPRQSEDSLYADEESEMVPRPRPGTRPAATEMTMNDEEDRIERNDGLRDSIATFGAIAGFREWNRARRERRERQRQDRIRQQELDAEADFNRRHTGYPNARPSQGPSEYDGTGRRPSTSGTLMTGPSGNGYDAGLSGSNPELSRTNFSSRPDTHRPPLPSTAGDLPSSTGANMGPSSAAPSNFHPTASQQRLHSATGSYSLPPPPPGPPPRGNRPDAHGPPEPGSLQMPQGAVEPDPSRLFSQDNVSSSHGPSGTDAAAGAAASDLGNTRRRRGSQSDSPSCYNNVPTASGSTAEASLSEQPPVNVRVKMHRDGDRVTFQRLTQEEADAKRAARRNERRQRRRHSSASDGLGSDVGMLSGSGSRPPGSNARFGRNGMGRRNSADQPITNVPPPPAMSAAGGPRLRQSSELMLPPSLPAGMAQSQPNSPAAAGALRPPPHVSSPNDEAGLSPPAPPIGSGLSSPGDAGTGTDVSAFADNRRRRRAERARRLEAARGSGGAGPRVEFQ